MKLWRRFGVFVVNFEYISRQFSIVDFEQENVSWVIFFFWLSI